MARSLGSNKEYFGRNLKLLAGVLLSIGLFFYAEIIKNSYNIFVVHNPTTATHKQREKHTLENKQHAQTLSPAVTVTMTTCNRLHLTQDSLRSFYKFNSDANIQAFKMIVDCYNESFAHTITQEFPNIELLSSVSNSTSPAMRVMDNVQLLYNHVLQEGTEFWVHMEGKSSHHTMYARLFAVNTPSQFLTNLTMF